MIKIRISYNVLNRLVLWSWFPLPSPRVRSLRAVTNCISDKLRRIFNPNIDPTSTQLIQGPTCAFRMICQEGRKICFHCRPIKVISQQNTTGSQQLEGLCNFQFCFSFQVSGIQIQKVLGCQEHVWVYRNFIGHPYMNWLMNIGQSWLLMISPF